MNDLSPDSIFVSYSRSDWDAYVYDLVRKLKIAGYKVWLDQNLIVGGADWLDEVNRGLEICERLILCVSPNALASKWVKIEYRYFLDENKPIIPVLCKPTKLPPELRRLQCLEYGNFESLKTALDNHHASAVEDDEKSDHSEPFGLPTEIATLANHTGAINALDFTPASTLLATASNDTTIKLWDIQTSKEVAHIDSHSGLCVTVAVDPRGVFIAYGTEGNTNLNRKLRLWEIERGSEYRTLVDQCAKLNSVAFSPDGKFLAVGYAPSDLSPFIEGTIKVWQMPYLEEYAKFVGHRSLIRDDERHSIDFVAFSSDSKLMASDLGDSSITIWDMDAKTQVLKLAGHRGKVLHGVFASGKSVFVSASRDKTVRLWDLATGDELATLTGHTDAVRFVDISPDGQLLVSASWDKTIRIWDIVNRRHLLTIPAHSQALSAAKFSPDGKILASASADGTAKLWKFT